MKKNTFMITLAAALCALTSCGRELSSFPDMAASPSDNTKAVAISSGNDNNAAAEKAAEETAIDDNSSKAENTSKAASEIVYENKEKSDTAAKKEFTKGRADGNVYISDYAGIKLTLPEEASFLDEDNLYTRYMMPTRFMSEEERNLYMTSVIDASVTYDEAVKCVDVWFCNTKQRYPETPDISVEEFVKNDELDNDPEIELTDIVGPENVSICGENYVRVSYTAFSVRHVTYARRIDDDYIMEIRTSGISADGFESRVEAIG
ncbi:hypothetical protein [Ruminococcus flavefaciens]|uniref:hypothetical protein n=1 Tax=Ruminococcus flavefaciens TaxID=1265 RepID=UPI0026E95005|nr:hypothetical protein [Ruminococcus flavefaciens]